MDFLIVLGMTLYVLALLFGLLCVPLGFPGTWIITAMAVVYSAVTDFYPGRSDLWVLVPLVIIAVLAEALEFGIGIIAGKRIRLSNGDIIASIAGGLAGALFGLPVPLFGSLLGLFVGVFLGTYLWVFYKKRDARVSLNAGLAVFFSRITAIFLKTALAFGMVVFLLVKTF